MATVQILTKTRMEEIEAKSIVGGSVVGGDLILTRHDLATINAGSVIGPQGPQGPVGEISQVSFDALEARVETLEAGRDHAERSDTALYTAYTAGSGWDASKAMPFVNIEYPATGITYSGGQFTTSKAGMFAISLAVQPELVSTGSLNPVFVNLWDVTAQKRIATGKIEGDAQTAEDRLVLTVLRRFGAGEIIQASAYSASGGQNIAARDILIYQVTLPV